MGGKKVAVGSGVGEITGSVGGWSIGVITVVVGGMEVIVGGIGVIVGETAVAEGEIVAMGVGCIGPEHATNRTRKLITAWELILFMIAPPYPLISTG